MPVEKGSRNGGSTVTGKIQERSSNNERNGKKAIIQLKSMHI